MLREAQTDYAMNASQSFPSFEEHLPFLDQFIPELVEAYHTEKINSWDELDREVKAFFTSERMEQMETLVPGWKKMASFVDGVTLTHVMCVFLGLYMMPELLDMSEEQKEIMKWVILLHDVEKQSQEGKRDYAHAFRSAAGAARILPDLGFPVTPDYDLVIEDWDSFTRSAVTKLEKSPDEVQDNNKLPEILLGIERMFGRHTSADLIIKTILFHLSVNMKEWPPPNPLNQEEIKRYIDPELLPLLRVMNLGDNDGWTLFEPAVREQQRLDIIEEFEKIEKIIS
jgi:hypothetical protein